MRESGTPRSAASSMKAPRVLVEDSEKRSGNTGGNSLEIGKPFKGIPIQEHQDQLSGANLLHSEPSFEGPRHNYEVEKLLKSLQMLGAKTKRF